MAALSVSGTSQLKPAEREVILAALEGCTNALAIYHHTLKKPQGGTADVSINFVFPEVEGVKTSDIGLSRDAAMKMQDIQKRAEYEKLEQDSLYVRKVMEDLKKEIRDKGTFEVLTNEIESIIARENEERALFKETEELQKMAADLRKTLADEKIAHEAEKKRLTKELIETQAEKDRLKVTTDVELRYIEAWKKSQREQALLRQTLEIEKLEKELQDCQIREKNEIRVTTELRNFFVQETASIENKIKEWEARYEQEKERYEKKIREVRYEIEDCQKNLEELKMEYRSNQEFIDKYLAEKEARQKQAEQEEYMRRSAIRIQAWWRGVMVRRKLGPYRPEEKKKKRSVKTKK
ncbi:hypothetical protein KM043_015832 [Ampulex compressa]|nr:hypothetical protein KM043_015832 [Ampulex compressa]